MMGHEDPPQPSMFYTSFNLDKRIRSNHPLRKVAKVLDWNFLGSDLPPSLTDFAKAPTVKKLWRDRQILRFC